MFGLMKPQVPHLSYRSAYARCCQFQRRAYGIVSLPILSYDAVFLYLCCMDAGLVPESLIKAQVCCRLRSDPRLLTAPDAKIGRFCGAISVLLADTKLQDDARDKGSIFARLGRLVLRNSARRAISFMSHLHPGFSALLSEWSATQVAIEADRARLTLGEFVGPTAHAVASVAVMMPESSTRPGLSDFLWSIGGNLGAATVAVDCALDWKDDLRTGNCNPVRDESGAGNAAMLGLDHLHRVVEACETCFGYSSRSAIVSRMVYFDVVRKLRGRCQLDDVVLKYADAEEGKEASMAHNKDEAVNRCVTVAERIGSSIGRREEPRKIDDSNEIECPRACQFSCQLIGSLPLLLGCVNHD
jgi:hypothetical protein